MTPATRPPGPRARSGASAATPKRRPADRADVVDGPRLTAYTVLRAVREDDAYANLVLPGLITEQALDARDAAFATELAYGTLRRAGTYDAIIGASSTRGIDTVDPAVLDILRLGAHQLLSMRTPAHAAVSAMVDLARREVGEGPATFVNAVLRRVSERDLPEWVLRVAPSREQDLAGHLSIAYAHPRWIVSAFRDALAGSWAETESALAADNVPAAVTLAARPGRASVADLERIGAVPGRFARTSATLRSGNPADLFLVSSGAVGVQDEGSQLVALAVADAEVIGGDVNWLDLCAGPGGKAALLGGLAGDRGAHLLAVERLAHRAAMVARATGDTATTVVADGTVPAWRPRSFDRVLVDAPCSGLGALRRRPEARWRRTPAELGSLGALQRRLLRSAIDAARPGGLVAYVTCSPHLAETVVVVDDVLGSGEDIERVDARPLLGAVPDLGPGPHIQLWPHRHGTDGMFLALLRRRP
jgi:16S rRNA (cytosine967-C5)-methyltransferase